MDDFELEVELGVVNTNVVRGDDSFCPSQLQSDDEGGFIFHIGPLMNKSDGSDNEPEDLSPEKLPKIKVFCCHKKNGRTSKQLSPSPMQIASPEKYNSSESKELL